MIDNAVRHAFTATFISSAGRVLQTKAQDAAKIAKMVGDFHKLSTESVDAEGLLNAIMTNPKMSIALLNAMFTDKHRGKGAILARMWDRFRSHKGELDKAANDPAFAQRKADEIMGGLGGELERLRGSIENFTLALRQAVEPITKMAAQAAWSVLDKVSELPGKTLAYGTGISTGAGVLASMRPDARRAGTLWPRGGRRRHRRRTGRAGRRRTQSAGPCRTC